MKTERIESWEAYRSLFSLPMELVYWFTVLMASFLTHLLISGYFATRDPIILINISVIWLCFGHFLIIRSSQQRLRLPLFQLLSEL